VLSAKDVLFKTAMLSVCAFAPTDIQRHTIKLPMALPVQVSDTTKDDHRLEAGNIQNKISPKCAQMNTNQVYLIIILSS